MPSETDLIKLYSDKILQMAAQPVYRERLSEPDASATKSSPLCGSAITVDIDVKDGIITKEEALDKASNPQALEMNFKGIFLSEGSRILN